VRKQKKEGRVHKKGSPNGEPLHEYRATR